MSENFLFLILVLLCAHACFLCKVFGQTLKALRLSTGGGHGRAYTAAMWSMAVMALMRTAIRSLLWMSIRQQHLGGLVDDRTTEFQRSHERQSNFYCFSMYIYLHRLYPFLVSSLDPKVSAVKLFFWKHTLSWMVSECASERQKPGWYYSRIHLSLESNWQYGKAL